MDGLGNAPQEKPTIVLKTKPFRSVREIKVAICKRFKIRMDELEGPSRRREFAIPRQIGMALAYKRLRQRGYSMPRIAREFGDRHHTTVLHACRKYGIPINPFFSARTVAGMRRRAERIQETAGIVA